jgi:hypothetical protein
MRTILAAALVGAVLIAGTESRPDPERRPSASLERAVPGTGWVSMDLSAGEYHIVGGGDRRIRLDWSARDRDTLSRIRARAEVLGRDVTIDTDGPENSGLEMTIQLPVRTDLHVRLTAGELTIEHIEGNKDVRLHAGELSIDVGRAEDYRRVEASVWAGEIDAPPFHKNKGGLFRSIDWRGSGPYRLEARLKAGEVRLHSGLRR